MLYQLKSSQFTPSNWYSLSLLLFLYSLELSDFFQSSAGGRSCPNTVNPISGFSKTAPRCDFQIKPFTTGQSSPHALFPAPWTWVFQTLQSLLDLCPASAPMCCLRKGVSTTSPNSESRAGPGSKKSELESFDQILCIKETHALCFAYQYNPQHQWDGTAHIWKLQPLKVVSSVH